MIGRTCFAAMHFHFAVNKTVIQSSQEAATGLLLLCDDNNRM